MWHTLIVVSMTAATGLYTVMGTSSQSPTGGTSSSYASSASQESRRQLESMSEYRRNVIEAFKQKGSAERAESGSNEDVCKDPWANYRDTTNGVVYIYVATGCTVANDLYQLLVEKTYNSALVGLYPPQGSSQHGRSGLTFPGDANLIQPNTPFWGSNTAVLASTSNSGASRSNGLVRAQNNTNELGRVVERN